MKDLLQGRNHPVELGGLDEEIVRTRLQALVAVLRIGIVREHNNDGTFSVFFHRIQNIDAAPAQEVNVQKDDIRSLAWDEADCFVCISGFSSNFDSLNVLKHLPHPLTDED